MPSRSRTPTTSSSSTSATGTAPVANDLTEGRGNAAMQGQLGAAGQTGTGTLDAAQSALNQHTESASVEVGGKLAGGLKLANHDGNEVTTSADGASFTIGVGRSGVYARFSPPLRVTPGGFWERMATGGITVSSVGYGFQSGRASVDLDTGTMGDVLDWFFDLKEDIEGKLGNGLKGALPARLRQGGFDPYTEPDLPALLQQIMTGFQGAFPAGSGGAGGPNGLTDKVTEPTLTARVSPKTMTMPMEGGLNVVIDERAWLELTAHFGGNLTQALAQPRISLLDLASDGVSIEHPVAGKLANVEVHRMTVNPDLSVGALDFEFGLENTVGALKALGMLLQLRTGQDLGIRDVNSPQFTQIRAEIERNARAKVPELLRAQILANDQAIPGYSLKSMFRM